MKIALLISGLPRMWNPCVATQINMLAPHDVGVFFHLWDTIDAAEKCRILALAKPVAHVFEPQRDFSAYDADPAVRPDNINIPSRMASQFYSWKQVGELFAPYVHEYDFALRVRADLQFVGSVNPVFPRLQKNDIVVPWWNENQLISDIFAMGDPQVVLYYHRLYDNLMDYAKIQLFNPEALLMQHLASAPVKPRIVTEADQQWYFVRRPHMANMTLDQCMQENAGRNKWFDPEVMQSLKDYHAKVKGLDAGARHIESFITPQMAQMAQIIKERLES